ncbi:helix-turn-helix transcriptional regulator [Actinokineospora sp. HUAS TT18]|uniref:helix-turn-helix transcriptional regulator n=1 Tax=Actinokineospora sp. HUAS TT18 TaxID=3447451 RepID=UPI003F52500F
MEPLLVERDGELAALAGVVAGVGVSSGFVVVEGPAGIGKSALLGSVAGLSEGTGARVLGARGTELERPFGFGLVRQLFEPVLVGVSAGQRAEWLSGAAGSAGAALGDSGVGDAPVGDFAVLHGLYWLTANLCANRPLLLVLDDLHWADAGSLRFLAYLLPRLEGLRLAVVVATRAHEPGAEQHLLDLLVADPSVVVLRPAPLSTSAVGVILGAELGSPVDSAFVAACASATGGNPLLLSALARVVVREGVAPTAANVGRVPQMGGDAIAARVRLRLSQMSEEAALLARAVAVLGDDVAVRLAGQVAGLSAAAAASAQVQLVHMGVLDRSVATVGDQSVLRFAHPVVRAAVYDQTDFADRIAGHTRAARLLCDDGAERVAAHLLLIPPTADEQDVVTLRRAAQDAARRGSPDTAYVYLNRCLAESMPASERYAVLREAAKAAEMVDLGLAVVHLREALTLTSDPTERASITQQMGTNALFMQEIDHAIGAFEEALAFLGDEAQWESDEQRDLAQLIQSGLVNVGLVATDRPELTRRVEQLRTIRPSAGIGGRALDGLLSMFETFQAVPTAIERARRCLRGGIPTHSVHSLSAQSAAYHVLLLADVDDIEAILEDAVTSAHRQGSQVAALIAHVWRCVGRLWRGALVDAEQDGRTAMRMVETTGIQLGRPFVGAFLGEVLLERGHTDQAAAVLDWADGGMSIQQLRDAPGFVYLMMDTRTHVLRARGEFEQALKGALATGERFAAHGGQNPAMAGWRAEAALCLHAIGRRDEAVRYADEELTFARMWGAPRTVGHALRVAGRVRGTLEGLPLLEEAVRVLEGSTAHLEYAKALIDRGSALRRSGQRASARPSLVKGLDLAMKFEATPMVDLARAELRASGVRPRTPHMTGPDALTPSEQRVAVLAAKGLSNRTIAQQLFVTTKTVEVHLGNAYRKLGITKRSQLAASLTSGPSPMGLAAV